MSSFVETIIQFGTLFGFVVGLLLGSVIGWIVRGLYHKRQSAKGNGSNADAIAAITSIAVISLWGMAHINNIFFGGADVNWVLNVIGGLAVSSLIQEKDGFIKIITAVRGGGSNDKK